MRTIQHSVDFSVVGGGIAGMSTAIAAARRGASVVLLHDRPVLGGNASSEVRMHICGAHGENMRETGIVEELKLRNAFRNPQHNYSIWDSVLYEMVRFEPNITLLLNCSAHALEMDGDHIHAVTGWQTTTETWHTVQAALFADCSGDSILAPLSGAEFRLGRETREEFGEDIAPEVADQRTMGLSCLIQFRETDRPQPFIRPEWANIYETDEDLQNRWHGIKETNYWWIELGGEQDSIHDAEELRDELLKVAFGVIDHIKNRGDHGAENWQVEWVGFLPGKRESRRYVGDHILTQHDVRAGGPFPDVVGYGGWSMDDHHPAGMRYPGSPTIFHPAPSPYGIPYRSLYSRNIANLLFAGRNISATHAAMSSTRVMSTCATLGQAVGTAAAIALQQDASPRGVYAQHLDALQHALMDDDCYLPGMIRPIAVLSQQSALTASEGDPAKLRNGIDRPVGEEDNGWTAAPGAWAAYDFPEMRTLSGARLVFDSHLTQHGLNLPYAIPLDLPHAAVPATLVKAFRLEARDAAGHWHAVYQTPLNAQRLVRVPLNLQATGLRLVPEATWGAPTVHVQAFEVE